MFSESIQKRYDGYYEVSMTNSRVINKVVSILMANDLLHKFKDLPVNVLSQWRSTLMRMFLMGGVSSNNHIHLFSNGDDAFSSMWKSIDSARKSICLETFQLQNDHIGLQTIQRLTKKAKEGVKVVIIYDWFGSTISTNHEKLVELKQAGATVISFNPGPLRWLRKTPFFRDHRKMLIIDDNIAYTGGMNWGKKYCGPKYDGTTHYHDICLSISGPSVIHMKSVFEESLEEANSSASKKGLYLQKRLHSFLCSEFPSSFTNVSKKHSLISLLPFYLINHFKIFSKITSPTIPDDSKKMNDVIVQVLSGNSFMDWKWIGRLKKKYKKISNKFINDLSKDLKEENNTILLKRPNFSFINSFQCRIMKATRIAFARAQSRVFFANAYFVPLPKLKKSIGRAAKRGVDVRMICSGPSDHPITRYAATHVYGYLLKKGVRIFEMQNSWLHSKYLTADGIFTTIGSFNYDIFSPFMLEMNVSIFDPKTSKMVENMFLQDTSLSKEITLDDIKKRPWYIKVVHFTAYRLSLLRCSTLRYFGI